MTTFTSEDRQAAQKEMNNEPVAYACKIIEAEFETNILKIEMLDKDYKVSAGIKYLSNTHPVKEQLTDEEIVNIGYHYGELGLNLEMIRAILRKASEK